MELLARLARLKRTEPTRDPRELRDTWQAASLLLEYPTPELLERLPMLRQVAGALDPQLGEPLLRTIDALQGQELEPLRIRYVETFDHTRRFCLYLSYFAHGDTRKRGVALVRFKQAFRDAGVELQAEELPDHLCVVLEFGATVDAEAAWKLLNEHRAGIEMLRLALDQVDSPWHGAVAALCATLPELGGDDREAVARLVAEGPPSEEVGLDTQPYAIDPRLNPHPQQDPERVVLGTDIPVGAPK
ncbi:nitrate reductase molybdenum cofactor assembly chaperone [Kytococcus sp. Marseille-QA3725]